MIAVALFNSFGILFNHKFASKKTHTFTGEVRKLNTSNQMCYFPIELKWITITEEAYDLHTIFIFTATTTQQNYTQRKEKQTKAANVREKFPIFFSMFPFGVGLSFRFSTAIGRLTYGVALVMIHELVVFMAGLFSWGNFVDKLAKRDTATLLYIWQLDHFVL